MKQQLKLPVNLFLFIGSSGLLQLMMKYYKEIFHYELGLGLQADSNVLTLALLMSLVSTFIFATLRNTLKQLKLMLKVGM